MPDFTPRQYFAHFKAAPMAVQNMLLSDLPSAVVYEIGTSYNILPKVSKVARISAWVMVGLVPITKFRETLEQQAGLDEQTARKVAEEIRDKIFMRVADELRLIHGLKREERQKEVPRSVPEGNTVNLREN